MEDAAKYADEIVIMHRGQVKKTRRPKNYLSRIRRNYLQLGLDVPEVVKFQYMLESKLG